MDSTRVSDFRDAYYVTRKNKRRSKDSVEFELHFERDVLRLIDDLECHTFEPSSYTFIVRRPRPREVFACGMALRIIDHYIDERMRGHMERELTARTFNNRIGFGGMNAINTLISDIYDVSQGFTRDAWVIKMDLKGYFPNADQRVVYQQLSDLVDRTYQGDDKDLLQYMLMRSVFSNPTKNCRRISPRSAWDDYPKEKSLFSKPDGIGGAIGRLLWQLAMNYYLNDVDHFMVDTCGLHYLRFVDDMVIVTDNKEACLSLVPTIREMAAEKGCTLHPKKFYCQHYTKGVEFLGSHIKMARVYVNNRTVRHAFERVHQFNRLRPTPRRLESFLSSMNSYMGIFKGRNAFNIMQRFIEAVDPKWWELCHVDRERWCLLANEGYRHNELIIKKFNLKIHKHEHKRKN